MSKHVRDKGFDICYGCGSLGEPGSFKDIDDIDFAIFCPKCLKKRKAMSKK